MKPIILLFTAIACLTIHPITAQQITGQIVDSKTQEAIPFATIQYGENQGVVSNMEGFFAIPQSLDDNTTLIISCMGFQTKEITFSQLKAEEFVIKLEDAVNQLDTVFLTNKIPNVESIMQLVNENLTKNYNPNNVQYQLFTRRTAHLEPKDLNVDIEKSSGFSKSELAATNKEFDALSRKIINMPPKQEFTDVLADFYYQNNEKSGIKVIKAVKLLDEQNTISVDKIQEQSIDIVLRHLDTAKSYKVKTGWFKVEDSLSIGNNDEPKKENKNDLNIQDLSNTTKAVLNDYQFGDNSLLTFVTDLDDYEYKLETTTVLDGNLVYVIGFEPKKRKAKFQGKLYINAEDYAVLRTDYGFAEGKEGQKLNLKFLLGFKYVENVMDGTIIYKKNAETGFYFPYYINKKDGKYAYIHRPFKFKENSEEKRHKVAFDMLIETDIFEKYEALVINVNPLIETDFANIPKEQTVEFQRLNRYDPTIWEGLTVLEPLEEMKQFAVEK